MNRGESFARFITARNPNPFIEWEKIICPVF